MRQPVERSNSRVLIVDPAPAVRQVMGDFLSEFYRVSLASSGAEALACLSQNSIDLLIIDGRLPGQPGSIEVLSAALAADPLVNAIVLSAPEAMQQARRAPAVEFLSKKLLGDETGRAGLVLLIDRLLGGRRQARAVAFQQRQSHRAGLTATDFLMGDSAAVEQLRAQVQQASRCDLNLLITGETGVGKPLIAEAVHSSTAGGAARPFVRIDPAALPAALCEAELFGFAHLPSSTSASTVASTAASASGVPAASAASASASASASAATAEATPAPGASLVVGATTTQAGAFEAADGGTLFFDEIGDIPPPLQAKISVAIELRLVHRAGDAAPLHTRVRVIGASSRALEQAIATGTLSPDFLGRLGELRITVPPLRQRREDVLPLFRHFLGTFCPEKSVHVTHGAERMLLEYPWPGNVRELRTLARRLAGHAFGDHVGEDDLLPMLPARADRGMASDIGIEERIRLFSRRAYLDALRANEFNIRRAAAALGLPYHTLRSRLTKLDLLGVVRDGRVELERQS